MSASSHWPLDIGHWTFRAGASRRDITPPADTPIIGYTQRYDLHPRGGHGGVLDPLFATVLVLDDGAHRLVLIALDLCILETEVAGRIRARLAPLAGTPPAHIVLACSHTHSGPYPWDPAWPGEPIENVGPGILGPSSAAYFAQLSDALAAAVGAAVTDLAPARLRSAETDLPHAYNRRVRLPGGGVGHAWDARVWTGPAPAPASDPRLVLLSVERDSRPPILVWNAGAHPVTLGKESNVVSADWPGAVRTRLESAYPGALTLFLNGASADAHPFLATGSDPADLDRVAAPIAEALLALPVKRAAHGRALYLRQSSFSAGFGEVRLTLWDLGVVRLLTLPGELFGEDGATLRRECPVPLLIAATTNGWTGYWMPDHEYSLGGYECDSEPLKTSADHPALMAAARSLVAPRPL